MARRPVKPKPIRPYRYETLEECEEAGLHRAEVTQWPPPRLSGEARPHLSVRCALCGCHLLVYGDNDPEQSGVEVIPPTRAEQATAGRK